MYMYGGVSLVRVSRCSPTKLRLEGFLLLLSMCSVQSLAPPGSPVAAKLSSPSGSHRLPVQVPQTQNPETTCPKTTIPKATVAKTKYA